ncbi:MAG: peptide/nickel transport system ATP-binding protein [Solirubrobacteraceae bacterium]
MSQDVATSSTVVGAPAVRSALDAGARLLRSARGNAPFIALAAIVIVAVAWPLFAPYSPYDTHAGPALQAPSWAHPFGTDQAGRDVLSRVLAGARISFTVGIASAAVAAALGGLLGTVAAMAPTWLGETIMRGLDVMLAFPAILLAVVLAAAVGSGMLTTIIVLSVVYLPALARFVRALVLGELGEDYVLSARVLGTRKIRLVGYHVGANIAIPVLVYAATITAEAIILEAALSYIGVGIQPPTPSWGNLINDGKALLYSSQWWISGFAGLAVLVSALTLNSTANALNRRLDAGVERT